MIRSDQIPLVLSGLFCLACGFYTWLTRALPHYALARFEGGAVVRQVSGWLIVEAIWPVAVMFVILGVLVAIGALHIVTIRPLEVCVAAADQQRVDAEARRQAVEQQAGESLQATQVEADRLARVDEELRRKTACVTAQSNELAEQMVVLNQRLRATAPKKLHKRAGSESGGPPKFF